MCAKRGTVQNYFSGPSAVRNVANQSQTTDFGSFTELDPNSRNPTCRMFLNVGRDLAAYFACQSKVDLNVGSGRNLPCHFNDLVVG